MATLAPFLMLVVGIVLVLAFVVLREPPMAS